MSIFQVGLSTFQENPDDRVGILKFSGKEIVYLLLFDQNLEKKFFSAKFESRGKKKQKDLFPKERVRQVDERKFFFGEFSDRVK